MYVCKLYKFIALCLDFCIGFFCLVLWLWSFDSKQCVSLNRDGCDYFIESFSFVFKDIKFRLNILTFHSKLIAFKDKNCWCMTESQEMMNFDLLVIYVWIILISLPHNTMSCYLCIVYINVHMYVCLILCKPSWWIFCHCKSSVVSK